MGAMVEQRRELGLRKAAVLNAIVEEYVRSGEPVGSETIAEQRRPRRVERHDPQRDGGARGARVPHAPAHERRTDPHRHRLPALRRLTPAARRHASATRSGARSPSYFAEAIIDLEEVLKGIRAAAVAADAVRGPGRPAVGAAEEPIVRLELIDMGPTMMVLAVGQHGRVDKRIIDRPEPLDDRALRSVEERAAGAARDDVPGGAGAAVEAGGRGRPRADHDLLLDVAETLRTATQGDGGGPRRGRRRVEPGRRGPGVAARDAPAVVRDARTRAGDACRSSRT